MSPHPPVDILILGLGWSGRYVSDLLTKLGITHAGTTTNGRDGTIPFTFLPDSTDSTLFAVLPDAKVVLVTFPVRGGEAMKRLTGFYAETHNCLPKYILFGSTRAWNPGPNAATGVWVDRRTPPDPNTDVPRVDAENALLACGGCVLNLAGLWGGERQPRNWLGRVASTKAALESKGSLHLVHGKDVARAVLAVYENFTPGERWLLSDMRVYDWWDLAGAWGTAGQQPEWVGQLLEEHGVKGLPRPAESLGRAIDTRDFWKRFGISPSQTFMGCDL
ncbi:hypothetical protein SpCBS45565_g07810 [Spizellomyces sp. 'palustris']|nr:hypothetical protein SpCBS45565_g07810 [Spizellomyces sp. 'palustris']